MSYVVAVIAALLCAVSVQESLFLVAAVVMVRKLADTLCVNRELVAVLPWKNGHSDALKSTKMTRRDACNARLALW